MGVETKTRTKELRARHGLAQEGLAKKVGVRRETILFIERAMTTVSGFISSDRRGLGHGHRPALHIRRLTKAGNG